MLSLLLSFISCEKDESNPIIGSWEGISLRTINYEDNEIVNDSTYTYEPEEFVLEIFADGKCKTYEFGDLDETFDWEVDGDMFSLKEGNNSRGAKFIINGDTLSMDFTSNWDEEGIQYKRVFSYILMRN